MIRVIGGKWRGRKIDVLDETALRPTPDRVRETLFNWLMHDVLDANCLDLYAGTGILGIESLSRGAKKAVFVEQNRGLVQSISNKIQHFKGDEKLDFEIIQADVMHWLGLAHTQQFDLVFVDPPYQQPVLPILEKLFDSSLLSAQAMIYVEQGAQLEQTQIPHQYPIVKYKQFGQVHAHLIRVENIQ